MNTLQPGIATPLK